MVSVSNHAISAVNPLLAIAQEFSPRYERHRDDLVSVDVSGLTRLLGPAQTIGEEIRREAAARGVRAHVAVAGTRMAALLLAQARPGLTVIAPGGESAAVASIPIGILEKLDDDRTQSSQSTHPWTGSGRALMVSVSNHAVSAFKHWGLKTMGELAALPSADLVSRLGRPALAWQAIARGEDIRPLVPMLEEERFESSLDLEWPIADLEPLSFVLTRLLEPLSTRLERRDRGAAVLHVLLRLVTRDPSTSSGREIYVRRLELPTPMRDVRALRTLALLDLEAHPADAAIDRVTIVIEPTPGRVVQHTLYTRAQPTPEQLSTLLARLGALMGQDRFGAPAAVDTHRPGAFAMTPFATDYDDQRRTRGIRREMSLEESAVSARSALNVVSAFDGTEPSRLRSPVSPASSGKARQSAEGASAAALSHQPSAISHQPLMSALRRCRQPVPARVAVVDGRPVRVTTDRRGFTGGAVTHCAGPWRTSGEWWAGEAGGAGGAGRSNGVGRSGGSNGETSVSSTHPTYPPHQSHQAPWNRDEWDLSLGDGAVYRVFRDRDANSWFIDAIVD
jgi:hypothetical protein